MGALSLFTTIFAPSECQIQSNPRRCLRNRMHGNLCNLCLQSCPTSALSYSGGSLHLAEEICSNCMVCTAVCPIDALMPKKDLQHLVDQAAAVDHATLLLSCEQHRTFRDNELLIPCLGIFSHELLVYMASKMPQKTIYFNVQGCRGCRNEVVSDRFRKNLESVLQFENRTPSVKMELIPADKDEHVPNDRRSFFRALRRDAMNTAASCRTARGKRTQQSATSRTISSKNDLLKNVLESDPSPHPLAARMVPRLSINEKCTPCSRCAGICPTGALRLVRTSQGKELEFDALSCCGCALCVDFCKNEALSLSCTLIY